MALAAKWAATSYGFPPPEILYVEETQGRGTVILGWDGMTASAGYSRNSWIFYRIFNRFYFAEMEGDTTLVYPAGWINPPHRNLKLYLRTERAGAVRVEASLRMREEADDRANLDWDRTYTLAGEANEHRIFPLEVFPRYGDDSETESFHWLQAIREGNGEGLFTAELSVTFYDSAGIPLGTWEKRLDSGQ